MMGPGEALQRFGDGQLDLDELATRLTQTGEASSSRLERE